MKKVGYILLCLFTAFLFVSCDSSSDADTSGIDSSVYAPWECTSYIVDPDDPFTGTWVDNYEDIIYDFYYFNGDGTGRFEHGDIAIYLEYQYNGAVLTLTTYPDTLDNPRIQYINYKVNGNEVNLVFEDGTEKIWYRYEE